MHREISQRELRNDSGAVLRDLVLGHSFTITRNGQPVGDLIPHKPTGGSTTRTAIIAAFQNAPHIDRVQFMQDIDAFVDQDSTPRG